MKSVNESGRKKQKLPRAVYGTLPTNASTSRDTGLQHRVTGKRGMWMGFSVMSLCADWQDLHFH